ncbi:MAG: rhodanese-like domain-containing protein [Gammaproteobacteria bacterium]
MIKDMSAPEAWALLNENEDAVMLDVRTTMEYEYVGHPPDAVLLPWKEAPDMQVDPEFVDKARDVLRKARPGRDPEDLVVLTLCRSGGRSKAAGEALAENGFRNVINVVEGFEGDKDENNHRGNINGWRYHNLPWEQS